MPVGILIRKEGNNMDLQYWAMGAFTFVLVLAIVMYGVYMCIAIAKGRIERITPDEKTFRLAFFASIMVVITYLAFGLGERLCGPLLSVLGTIAGYVLGGVTSRGSHSGEHGAPR